MTDYISREAAIEETRKPRLTDAELRRRLAELPAADVAPVVHGRWEITDAYPHNVHCSVCHKRFAQTHWEVWEDGSLPRNYCPNCGARMMETENEQKK